LLSLKIARPDTGDECGPLVFRETKNICGRILGVAQHDLFVQESNLDAVSRITTLTSPPHRRGLMHNQVFPFMEMDCESAGWPPQVKLREQGRRTGFE
jgi:hypothetical protein